MRPIFTRLQQQHKRVPGGLLRAISPNPPRKVWVFNYGSNHQVQLAERVGDPSEVHAAHVDGYQRVFRGHSRGWGCGVASLQKKAGSRTYGYVARVTPDQLDLMDRYEGVNLSPPKYKRIKVKASIYGGETVTAVAYVSTSRKKTIPSQEYLEACAMTVGGFWGDVSPSDFPLRNPGDLRSRGIERDYEGDPEEAHRAAILRKLRTGEELNLADPLERIFYESLDDLRNGRREHRGLAYRLALHYVRLIRDLGRATFEGTWLRVGRPRIRPPERAAAMNALRELGRWGEALYSPEVAFHVWFPQPADPDGGGAWYTEDDYDDDFYRLEGRLSEKFPGLFEVWDQGSEEGRPQGYQLADPLEFFARVAYVERNLPPLLAELGIPAPTKSNPADRDLRALERAAASGDQEAAAYLHHVRIRTEGEVPRSHRICMAVRGVWTPWASILCLRCDPQGHPQQFAEDPGEHANARCDRCGVPIYLYRDDVALLQQLNHQLRAVYGIDDLNLWQTGGMCAALGVTVHVEGVDAEYMVSTEGLDPDGTAVWYIGVSDPDGEGIEVLPYVTFTGTVSGMAGVVAQHYRGVLAR